MIGAVSRYLGSGNVGTIREYEEAVEKLESFGDLTKDTDYQRRSQVNTELLVETAEGASSIETGGLHTVSDHLGKRSTDRRHVLGSDLETVSSWIESSEIRSSDVKASDSGFGIFDLRNMQYDDLRFRAEFSGRADEYLYFRGAPVVDQGEEFRLEYEASIPGKTGWENTQLREFIENF